MKEQRIWIVGASSGIGLELVKTWLQQENSVIASAPHATSAKVLLDLKQLYGSRLQLIDVDVTSAASVNDAVSEAWQKFDGLDLWFYNAAVYEVTPVEELNISHFNAMMQVNYLGAVRVMTVLFPFFKEQKKGRWVWNASLASCFGLPFGGGYSATKAALVNLAESLHPELQQHGIEIQVINHGFVKTRLTAKNNFEMPQLMTPEFAAEEIVKGISKPYRFEIHFPFKLSALLRLLRFLPYSLSLKLTRRMMS